MRIRGSRLASYSKGIYAEVQYFLIILRCHLSVTVDLLITYITIRFYLQSHKETAVFPAFRTKLGDQTLLAKKTLFGLFLLR